MMDSVGIQEQKMVKAHAIISMGKMPEMVSEKTYKVPSQRGNWLYNVTENNGSWSCDCPDHNKRQADCKHIYTVKIWLELKDSLKEPEYKPLTYHNCPYCGSCEVVKNGTRKTKNGRKTRFLCRDCNRTFSLQEDGFENMMFDSKVVTEALSLYFSGVSYRKVAQHLRQKGINIDHTTVYYWVKHYSKMISDFVDTFRPEIGDTWNADEMLVRVREGGSSRYGYKFAYLWNVLDAETRFLLANRVSDVRNIKDAIGVFRDARSLADAKPEKVVTDGYMAYPRAFNKVFYDNKMTCKHEWDVGIQGAVNNNKVERFHSSVREREKVMRGMQKGRTANDTLKGYRAYYNFVRPHTALGGMTPAEKAGIDLNLGADKWKRLIELASTADSTPKGQMTLNSHNQP